MVYIQEDGTKISTANKQINENIEREGQKHNIKYRNSAEIRNDE